MTRVCLIFLLALTLTVPGWHAAQAEDPHFILALSWHPAFCASQAGSGRAECREDEVPQPRFVLHGLWPAWDRNGDGRVDAADDYCVAPAERAALIARDRAMKGSWLGLPEIPLAPKTRRQLDEIMPGTLSGLERHEWLKHGTCSELTTEAYFTRAASLTAEFVRSDLAHTIAAAGDHALARADLIAVFVRDFGEGAGKSLQLLCHQRADKAYLREIRLYLTGSLPVDAPLVEALLRPARPKSGNCPNEILIGAPNS